MAQGMVSASSQAEMLPNVPISTRSVEYTYAKPTAQAQSVAPARPDRAVQNQQAASTTIIQQAATKTASASKPSVGLDDIPMYLDNLGLWMVNMGHVHKSA
jgi:hypothetical protein